MEQLVFVYGTLKRGHRNHYILDGSDFVGRGMTAKQFRMVDVGFPVILMPNSVARVCGEVYRVDDQTLSVLDRLESNGRMYQRRQLLVLTPKGCSACWTYVGIHKFWHSQESSRFVSEVDPVDSHVGPVYSWRN